MAEVYDGASPTGTDYSSATGFVKYGLTVSPSASATSANGVWVDEATLTATWYMPLEPATKPSTESATTTDGDRLDRGDKVSTVGWAIADGAMTLCNAEGVKLSLGAEIISLGVALSTFFTFLF